MIRNQHHQVAKDSRGLVATDRQRQDNLCPTATEFGRMLEVHSCSDQQLWSGAWKSRSGEITVTVFFMVA